MAASNRTNAVGPPRPDDLRSLCAPPAAPCVSLYVPLEVAVPVARKNPVRYAHAVEAALTQLAQGSAGADLVDSYRARLEPVDAKVRAFEHPTRTLAVFADRAELFVFGLEPAFDERVAVGASFAIRPLLRAVQRQRPYRVLAISVNRVALYEGDARGLREREIEGLPKSLVDALGAQVEAEGLEYRATRSRGGDQAFPGHGGEIEERDVDLARYHLAVARPLVDAFKSNGEYFVVAGDDRHQGPLHEHLAPIPGLLPDGLRTSPDRLAPHELHARTWPLVEAAIAREDREAADAFETARNHGKGLEDLEEIVRAAVASRIRRLWIETERRIPGRVDEMEARIAAAEGDEDALDELASLVVRRGGEARVADPEAMPTRTGVAAQLR